MATNIDIDQELLAEALALGPFRTKKAAVNEALAEYVQRRKQRRILEMVGKVEYYPDYDYKAMRRKR